MSQVSTLVTLATLTLLALACGGEPIPAEHPRTRASSASSKKPAPPGQGEAARRAQQEHAAAGGDRDLPTARGKKWGGWKYQGAADDCFYLVGRRCYAELDDACEAARCGKKDCVTDGAGPATVRCD